MTQKFQFNEQKLKEALEIFQEYSKEKRFQNDIAERLERKRFFQEFIKKEFNEFNFSEMIKKLWAVRMWTNKDYLASKIIKDNKLDKLKNEFNHLVSHRNTPGERYEKFLRNIKGMGPAMVTEILCHTDPKNAGIWNDRARKALAWLELKIIPYDKYKISGREYDEFNKILREEFISYFKREGYKDVDFLFIDYFFWEIWSKFAKSQEITRSIVGRRTGMISRHDELRDKIAEIGSRLGFEVDTEKSVAVGARIDVVWKARIANLGAVSYVFEVQERGSIDSLIVNLQRVQANPTVQKLIIVSDAEQIAKIQEEIETMPEHFRKAVVFWEGKDVEDTYQNLEQVTESIAKLKLIEE